MGITRAGEQQVNLEAYRQHELQHQQALDEPPAIDDANVDPSVQSPELHNQVPAWSERDDGIQARQAQEGGSDGARFRRIGAGLRNEETQRPQNGTVAEREFGDSQHLHSHSDLVRAQRAGGGTRTGGGQANRLDYDTSHYALRARQLPTAAADRQQLRTQLSGELDRIYGQNNWTINGAAQGSDQELRAMDALGQYGRAQRNGQAINHRGTESDLLVPGHGGAASMRMTTQMTRGGQITADVHAATGTPTPTRTFASAADAQRAIQQDFGVTVRGRDQANPNSRDFSQAELTQVYHSLSQLDANERAQIRGLDFIRQGSPPQGQSGDTSGLYSPNTTTTNGTRDRPASITLYDNAFSGNQQAFVGSSGTAHQHSQVTILHEVGHAIEDRAANDATVALNQRINARNTAASDLNAANTATTQPLADADRANGAFVRAANRQMRSMSQAERRQTTAYNNARNGVTTAMNGVMNARTPAQLTAAQTRLNTAVQARDTAFNAMAANHPVRSEAQAANAAQDAALPSVNVAGQRQVDFQTAVAAQAAAQRTLDGVSTGGTSARLRSFQAALRQDTSPTDYGRTSAAEAFAESYMLFKSDPTYLQNNRPNIHRWFQQGNHLR